MYTDPSYSQTRHLWMQTQERGDKRIKTQVLKADASWGWGICAVICSFRRHLSLGMRALLQEVCNEQRNPPALRTLGSVTPGTSGGSDAASPAAAVLPRSPSSHGRDGPRQACVAPGASLRGRSWRNLSPAPGEVPPAGALSPPLLLCRRQRPAPLSALFLEIRRIGWGEASHSATEESVAVPVGAKLPIPGAKRKPLHDRNVK